MPVIPLPALDVAAPNSSQLVNSFSNLIKLRQLGIANAVQQQQNEQRNQILQQNANTEAQRQAMAQQQAQDEAQRQSTLDQAYRTSVDPQGNLNEGKLRASMAQGNIGADIPDAEKTIIAMHNMALNQRKQAISFAQGIAPKLQAIPNPQDRAALAAQLYTWAGDDSAAYLWKNNPAQALQMNAALAQPSFKEQTERQQASAATSRASTAEKQEQVNEQKEALDERLDPQRANAETARAQADVERAQRERAGVKGSSKYSPDNPAPKSQFDALDDEKDARLEKLKADIDKDWATAQSKTSDDATLQATKEQLFRSLQAGRQKIQDWYETQNRKLGGLPAHYSYLHSSGQAASKPITADIARHFLSQAGGNKDAARELARKAGYTF